MTINTQFRSFLVEQRGAPLPSEDRAWTQARQTLRSKPLPKLPDAVLMLDPWTAPWQGVTSRDQSLGSFSK